VSRPYTTRRDIEETSVRPLYVRVLRLRHFQPSGMVCFILLEGSIAAALLLALAELVSWWGLIVIPVAVAVLVKANDVLAAALARSADRVPQQERERLERQRLEREVRPAVGRATVPVSPAVGWRDTPSDAGRTGTVYVSSGRLAQSDDRGSDQQGGQDQQPQRQGQQPQWQGAQGAQGGQGAPPQWQGGQPPQRGDPPAWRGEQPDWHGDQRDWPRMQPGRQPNERGYG
jgi:hypothetical protein